MKQVTLLKFKQLYEDDLIFEVFAVGNTIYGKSVEGQASNSRRHETVFCTVV